MSRRPKLWRGLIPILAFVAVVLVSLQKTAWLAALLPALVFIVIFGIVARGRRGARQPDMRQTGRRKPETKEPGMRQPGMRQPGMRQPDIKPPARQQPDTREADAAIRKAAEAARDKVIQSSRSR